MEKVPDISRQFTEQAFALYSRRDVEEVVRRANDEYWYWSDLRYKTMPDGVSARDLWSVVKLSRMMIGGFQWGRYGISLPVTNRMLAMCHQFDLSFRMSSSADSIVPDDDRDQYMVSSLMEEAISSSQMEGAATTRKVAKDMLRKNNTPRSRSEQMIHNNYVSIRFIADNKDADLTPELLLRIHYLMTHKTLANEEDAGRFRTNDEVVVENSITHEVVHTPPTHTEIPGFVDDLCTFANSAVSVDGVFVHPILKAIFIHFLVSFYHPFVDGNGRTARALFYWYMLKNGYWMAEYLSISRIIYRSKASYEKSFQYCEADGNDTGYFVSYNLHVLDLAFKDLKAYIDRKLSQKRQSLDLLRLGNINDRQAAILSIMMTEPGFALTVKEMESRFSISHTTAKSDIDSLVARRLLRRVPVNKVKSIYLRGEEL